MSAQFGLERMSLNYTSCIKWEYSKVPKNLYNNQYNQFIHNEYLLLLLV
jgi:hypothetical protein